MRRDHVTRCARRTRHRHARLRPCNEGRSSMKHNPVNSILRIQSLVCVMIATMTLASVTLAQAEDMRKKEYNCRLVLRAATKYCDANNKRNAKDYEIERCKRAYTRS